MTGSTRVRILELNKTSKQVLFETEMKYSYRHDHFHPVAVSTRAHEPPPGLVQTSEVERLRGQIQKPDAIVVPVAAPDPAEIEIDYTIEPEEPEAGDGLIDWDKVPEGRNELYPPLPDRTDADGQPAKSEPARGYVPLNERTVRGHNAFEFLGRFDKQSLIEIIASDLDCHRLSNSIHNTAHALAVKGFYVDCYDECVGCENALNCKGRRVEPDMPTWYRRALEQPPPPSQPSPHQSQSTRSYSDSDFIGIHKPAMINLVLDLVNKGFPISAALGNARAQVEKDRERIRNGGSAADTSEVAE
jgi:hypothetical protein